MKRILGLSIAIALLMAIGWRARVAAQHQDENQDIDRMPIKHRIHPDHHRDSVPTGSTGTVTPSITYHGGPVLATPTVYIIWYGNWNQSNGSDNPAGQQIIRDFANNVSNIVSTAPQNSSNYFQINTTYSAGGTTITGNVVFGGETSDNYSQGARLTDSRVKAVVNRAINNHFLPYDPTGVYFVLSSSDVSESSGFCTQYCGWHTSGSGTYGTIRYSFVGNANRCLSACAAQTISPNGNAGVDGMISVIAHELEEATSDPDLNAWYDSSGSENADKCAWTFGHSLQQLASGAYYNMTLTTQSVSRKFLIQRNLKHSTSGDTCNVDLNNQ
jgi:hypothetical protein